MKLPPVIVVQIIHITGPLKGQIQEFSEAEISIGRLASCHVRFPADLAVVSRKQAEIVREGNRFKLTDHSTNGTLVNGKRVQETYLRNGDVLEFSAGGPKASFLTEIRESQPEAAVMLPPVHREPPAEPPPVRPRPPREETPRTPPPREEPQEVAVQKSAVPLVIQFGPTIRTFRELPVTLGKSPKCDLILNTPGILDLHAQIFFDQGRYWVKDLTGQGIVRVNRQPVLSHAALGENDLVSIAPRGPCFRYLGEGRLAESAVSTAEESPAAPEGPKAEGGRKDRPEDKSAKGLLSRFLKDR